MMPRDDAGLDALAGCLRVLKGKGWTPHSKIVRESAMKMHRLWQADPDVPVDALQLGLRQLMLAFAGFIVAVKGAEQSAKDRLN